MENQIVVNDYRQMDKILKEERTYLLNMVKKIKATGCNVLLIQKSILRDAVTDLSLHFLAKTKIMVVKEVERDEVEFICKVGVVFAKQRVFALSVKRETSPPMRNDFHAGTPDPRLQTYCGHRFLHR